MVPDQDKPEEYRRGDWASVPEGPPGPSTRGVSAVSSRRCTAASPSGAPTSSRDAAHPPGVAQGLPRLLGSQPAKRYNPKKLVDNSSLFANKLVETITFLDNLSLKDSIEKEQFFRNLPA